MSKITKLLLASIFSTTVVLSACTPPEEEATAPAQQPAATVQPIEPVATPVPQPVVAQQTAPAAPAAPAASASPKKKKKAVAAPSATPAAAAAPAAAADPSLTPEKKILAKIQKAYDDMKDYVATIEFMSKKNAAKSPDAKDLLKATFKYTFQKPRMEAFTVLKHTISIAEGAKLVWTGDKQAKAKAGILSLTLELTDSKITTNRNWSFAKLDHVAILERLNDPRGKLVLAGVSNISGKDCYILKLVGPIIDDDITEEAIAVDKKTFYMISDEMYVGEDKVFDLKINIESANSGVSPDTFQL
ncbi:MAG: hypothetical protein U0457_18110 [Candidatus Sericytochromatia bacterium]